MPTADDEMARNCAKSFCENFLRAGGLRLDFKISIIYSIYNTSFS